MNSAVRFGFIQELNNCFCSLFFFSQWINQKTLVLFKRLLSNWESKIDNWYYGFRYHHTHVTHVTQRVAPFRVPRRQRGVVVPRWIRMFSICYRIFRHEQIEIFVENKRLCWKLIWFFKNHWNWGHFSSFFSWEPILVINFNWSRVLPRFMLKIWLAPSKIFWIGWNCTEGHSTA